MAAKTTTTTAPSAPKITLDVPPTTAAAPSDRYGLGADWRGAMVTAEGLLPSSLPSARQVRSAEDVFSDFLHQDDPTVTAQIQQQLFYAGLYSKDYTPTLGVLRPQDIDAFKSALEIAAKTGGDLTAYLSNATDAAKALGSPAANYQTNTHVLQLTDPEQSGLTIDKAFQAAIGKKPTAAQRAAFVAHFSANETAAQQGVFAAQDQADAAYTQRQATGGTTPTAGSDTNLGAGLDSSAPITGSLAALIAAAPGKITVTDGKRTTAQQTALKKSKPGLAADPGHSKHETGEAADLKFDSPATEKWAHDNAARFGLSFPMLNQGYGKYEPWHIELPGTRGSHTAGAVTNGPAGPNPDIPISQTVTSQNQNLDAQAIDTARAADPNETQAHDLTGVYSTFTNLLKGI